MEDSQPQKCYVYDEKILQDANKDGRLKLKLNENFKLRPLEKNDYNNDYLSLLAQLTEVGNVTEEKFHEMFFNMKNNGCYYVTVIEDLDSNKIIGSATLFNEYKFIHGGCLRARIEDVVVDSEYRGKKLGNILIETLKNIAILLDCYKLTLDCKDEMIPWYQKFGFQIENGRSNFMTIRFH